MEEEKSINDIIKNIDNSIFNNLENEKNNDCYYTINNFNY